MPPRISSSLGRGLSVSFFSKVCLHSLGAAKSSLRLTPPTPTPSPGVMKKTRCVSRKIHTRVVHMCWYRYFGRAFFFSFFFGGVNYRVYEVSSFISFRVGDKIVWRVLIEGKQIFGAFLSFFFFIEPRLVFRIKILRKLAILSSQKFKARVGIARARRCERRIRDSPLGPNYGNNPLHGPGHAIDLIGSRRSFPFPLYNRFFLPPPPRFFSNETRTEVFRLMCATECSKFFFFFKGRNRGNCFEVRILSRGEISRQLGR